MKDPGRIGAVILAAGRSSRMGRCKALLPLGGESLELNGRGGRNATEALEQVDDPGACENPENPQDRTPHRALASSPACTALGWAVRSLRLAGICDLVVVTGYERALLVPLLEGLCLRGAHNPHYDLGMFSSVQTGVAALSPGLEGAVLLPVDSPLVRPETLRSLVERSRTDVILHPTCCGRRGHPPLVGADYFSALLSAPPTGTLRDFFAQHAEAESEVQVEDLSILLDMDTPKDFHLVSHLASLAASAWARVGLAPAKSAVGSPALAQPDTAGARAADLGPPVKRADDATLAGGPATSLDQEDCLTLLKALGTPPSVIQHCLVVAQVGRGLAQGVASKVGGIDPDRVAAACLLHDMVRSQLSHALLAERLLDNLGLKSLAALVAGHMVLDPDLSLEPGLTETELVYLADKVVFEATIVGLDERERRALLKMESSPRDGPEAERRVHERMAAARRVAAKVEALVGQPLDVSLERIPTRCSTHQRFS